MDRRFDRACAPQFGTIRAMLALAAFACATAPPAQAEPITFRFDAEVASVSPTNGGAGPPFEVSAGDSVVTTFIFEPERDGPNYPQSGLFKLEINGHILEISGYEIGMRNDAPGSVPHHGRIADPINAPIEDEGPGGSSDNLALSCLPHTGPSQFHCGSVTGHPEVVFRPLIGFSHADQLLASEDLPIDLAVWNAFSFREMSLSFLNTATKGETYIGAYVGTVRSIPEPATTQLGILGAIVLALTRIRRRCLATKTQVE